MSAQQWPTPVAPVVVGPGLVTVTTVTTTPSEGFVQWLARSGSSLAVTTGDRLMTIGTDGTRLTVAELRFDHAMGLAADLQGTLHLASRWQLHELHDALAVDGRSSGRERLLATQSSHTTGFAGVRDVAVDSRGRVLFTAALCNAVATPGARTNLDLVARPPYITEDVAEERCHVVGLALDGGDLAYLTCAADTDEPGGWQAGVADGGVVVDVRADRVLARGLSLPCSPRLHEGRLYVANAGTGELLLVDRETGGTSSVARLPGMARGLAFVAGHAVVGCSVPSDEGPYASLPIALAPPEHPRHGLAVVDVETGTVVHSLTLEAGSGEVHAIAALDGADRVALRGQQNETDGWFVLKTPTT